MRRLLDKVASCREIIEAILPAGVRCRRGLQDVARTGLERAIAIGVGVQIDGRAGNFFAWAEPIAVEIIEDRSQDSRQVGTRLLAGTDSRAARTANCAGLGWSEKVDLR